MKTKLFSAIKYILLFGVGLGLLWLTFRNENLAEVWGKIKVADPYWLTLSLILALFAFISRAVRWIMLMEPLGYKPKLSNTLYALLIGYFANLAIPRIGEITRCGALANVEKVPFNSLIGTVIVERVIDLLMLFLTMTLVFILEYDILSGFIYDKILAPLGGKLDIGANSLSIWLTISAVLVAVIVVWLLVRMITNQKNQSVFAIKIRGIMHEVGSGFKTILRMKKNGWFIFHTIFIWVIYFLMTWVCFFCLDATSHLGMKEGLFILVVGGLGMSAPVQGGIGAYHYIVSQGLQLFGVSSTDGIAYATLVHTTQTLLVVFLGIFAMLMLFIIKRKSRLNG